MDYKDIVILAIETSCDDTSIAILKNGKVVANQTYTKFEDHKKYGGIIPELASRNHANHLALVLEDAFHQAKLSWKEITHIAYTANPGLLGSLLTGKVFAQTLAYLYKKPLIKINHMIAHAFSFSIEQHQEVDYPFLCLDASGGHTIIYLFRGLNKYRIVNQSHDDAVGECLDKIGRILNLPYPGGISLDQQYNETKTNFPLIKHAKANKNFSFSGLKTHITNKVHQLKQKHQPIDPVLIGSSVLKWCIDDLIIKLQYYIAKFNPKFVAIGGGVAANSLLRQSIKQIKIPVKIAEKKYCGDNAAMIAHLAYLKLKR
ncbi:MAG: tRNA (adenosine(37)-N6)-threonylcarbamoyltransferase complex transferase subunit TsaD [Mycoplasma sp.]